MVLLSLSRGSRGAESTLVILWREQRCGPIQAVALSERDLVVAAADHNTASTATENATEADAESLKENSRPAIPDGRAALGSNRNSAQVGPSWGPASASSTCIGDCTGFVLFGGNCYLKQGVLAQTARLTPAAMGALRGVTGHQVAAFSSSTDDPMGSLLELRSTLGKKNVKYLLLTVWMKEVCFQQDLLTDEQCLTV